MIIATIISARCKSLQQSGNFVTLFSGIPIAEKFWKLCVLPELLGKWFTHHKLPNCNVETEDDSGRWCFCKEDRGGGMIGCDGKSCEIKWFHLTCLGMTESSIPKGKWFCPTCKDKRKS